MNIENGLIPIQENENGEITISGRLLHEKLKIETQYSIWFNRMCEYGFIENADYTAVIQKRLTAQGNETTYLDHILKLDMAKEIAMVQRSEEGQIIRKYFIDIEKAWNSPDMIMKRALQIANDKLIRLETTINEQKPKVIFADSVEASSTSTLIGNLAKLIKQNGYDIGQNRLFKWLRENDYLCKRKGDMFNMPTQKSMELELMEVKESTVNFPDGNIRINKTAVVTGKGQVYFINKFLNNEQFS